MNKFNNICECFSRVPNAVCQISGGEDYKSIKGKVKFYQFADGVVVTADIKGLPKTNNSIYGFHIHSGNECSGNEDDEFFNAGNHYNPKNALHPNHAGDFPVLFGVNGKAYTMFLTDRFLVSEIIGKAVIIHSMSDDYITQPSGNSGVKIACGIIKAIWV